VELPASLRVTAKDALRKVLLEIVGEWWELTFYRHHLGIVYIYITLWLFNIAMENHHF
jgi:hypothetical protein